MIQSSALRTITSNKGDAGTWLRCWQAGGKVWRARRARADPTKEALEKAAAGNGDMPIKARRSRALRTRMSLCWPPGTISGISPVTPGMHC